MVTSAFKENPNNTLSFIFLGLFLLTFFSLIPTTIILLRIESKFNDIKEKRQHIYFNQVIDLLIARERSKAIDRYNDFIKNKELRIFINGMLTGQEIGKDDEKVRSKKMTVE